MADVHGLCVTNGIDDAVSVKVRRLQAICILHSHLL